MKIKEPQVKIGDRNFTLKNLTFRIYNDIQEILTVEEDDRSKEFKIASILTDLSIQELKSLPYEDWIELWFLCESRFENLTSEENKIIPTINFNGKTWGLISVEQMTIGEFAELDILSTSPGAEKRLHEYAAVLYKPVKKKLKNGFIFEEESYNDLEEKKEDFLDFPLVGIRSANYFFFRYLNRLLENTVNSLTQNPEVKKKISPQDLDLLKRLVQEDSGGTSSIHLLEKIHYDLMKLQDSKFAPGSIGSLGKKTLMKKFQKIFKINR